MKEEAINEIIEAYTQLMRSSLEVGQQWMHCKIPEEVNDLIKETRDCLDVLLDQMYRIESRPDDDLANNFTYRINQLEGRLRRKWEELQNEGELT